MCSLLSENQKENNDNMPHELLDKSEKDQEFLSKITGEDQKQVYRYNPEIKQQLSQWNSPKSAHPKRARQVCRNVNNMLIGFLNMHGLVTLQICSIRKNINQHYNKHILRCLQQEKKQRKQNEKLNSGDWFLHRDNAPVNSALSVEVSVSKTKWLTSHNLPALWV